MLRLVVEALIAGTALFALIQGLFEYRQQGAQKRADRFIEMRWRFKDNKEFSDLCLKLEGRDEAGLTNTPYRDKRDFLGFYQEVALLVNSDLIPKEVASYMFGYYANLCLESRGFWSGPKHPIKDSPGWALFRDFAEEMAEIDKAFKSEVAKGPQRKLELSKYRF